MTLRLVLSKNDPRHTDFVLVGDHPSLRGAGATDGPIYSSDTANYAPPRNGVRAATTITRTASTGDHLQVGIIEWPILPHDRAQLVVGTRTVHMTKAGIYTSPERFTAADGGLYEWQIYDARPQLVPIRTHNRTSSTATSRVATFVQSESGFWPRRKRTSSLFISPEAFPILDDIVVTFIYFQSRWSDKEGAKARSSISGPVM